VCLCALQFHYVGFAAPSHLHLVSTTGSTMPPRRFRLNWCGLHPCVHALSQHVPSTGALCLLVRRARWIGMDYAEKHVLPNSDAQWLLFIDADELLDAHRFRDWFLNSGEPGTAAVSVGGEVWRCGGVLWLVAHS
jgi:hypothetical protein